MPHEIIGELIVGAIEVGVEVGSEVVSSSKNEKSKAGCFAVFLIVVIAIGCALYYFNNY